MSDRTIKDSGGDLIKNENPDGWAREECAPKWAYD